VGFVGHAVAASQPGAGYLSDERCMKGGQRQIRKADLRNRLVPAVGPPPVGI
jgi:hypothetical protein